MYCTYSIVLILLIQVNSDGDIISVVDETRPEKKSRAEPSQTYQTRQTWAASMVVEDEEEEEEEEDGKEAEKLPR